jgi:hypothetical protein
MVFKSALATILMSASLFAAKPNIVHDAEDFDQPGIIQFRGITEYDEVRIDGELLPPQGLARMSYNLLIAPGEYVVAIKLASQGKECNFRLRVAPGETVRPACTRQQPDVLTD